MTLYNLKREKVPVVKPSYPATSELFLLIRRVVAARRGVDDAASLMDIEIGSLLGYDYKYTHQWRFGKKRMLDTSELEELAREADVPFDILRKVAIGVWSAEQAWMALQRRRKETFKKISRKLNLDGVEVEVEFEVAADRVAAVDAALDVFKQRVAERINNPRALFPERQAEIKRFESFVSEMRLPRVAFYRKPA